MIDAVFRAGKQVVQSVRAATFYVGFQAVRRVFTRRSVFVYETVAVRRSVVNRVHCAVHKSFGDSRLIGFIEILDHELCVRVVYYRILGIGFVADFVVQKFKHAESRTAVLAAADIYVVTLAHDLEAVPPELAKIHLDAAAFEKRSPAD